MKHIKLFEDIDNDLSTKSTRESGYYWILLEDEWMPSRYDSKYDWWDVCGSDEGVKKEEIERIGDKIEYIK